jgi:hypothetical protein
VPSPEALDAINSALRSALEGVKVESFEEGKSLLQEFLARVEDILDSADSFVLLGLDFSGPQADAVRAAMERLIASVEDLITSPTQVHSMDAGPAGEGLSACDKAAIRGVGAITLGAIFGGIPGAVAGFLAGVIDLALEC